MLTLPSPNWFERNFQRVMYSVLHLMRRFERYGFRQIFNAYGRELTAAFVQWVMNLRR